MKHRNKYIHGTKDNNGNGAGNTHANINADIIRDCDLKPYSSAYKLLEHFYHVDTYKSEERGFWRLQGYIYPEDVVLVNQIDSIGLPPCEVAYMDDRLILFFGSIRHELVKSPV